MIGPTRANASIAIVLVVSATAFLTGIHWGLPSRSVDRNLFGDQTPWSGDKIVQLAPSDSGVLGADVDSNPILNRSVPIVLNATDKQRAEIIRRYRLFSYQPDEFITFKSLSRIREHQGDPRLYQYGGLWIYPVGAFIKVFINPQGGQGGQAYYLDHPDEFGRFYIVARLYSAAWGLLAVWAIFWIVRRITADHLLAAAGGICFAFMPVVITMAHEAKPHLGGLALTLCATIAAAKFVQTGLTKWTLLAGALCGAACGIVLSGAMSFAILPMMVLIRRDRVATLIQSCAVGVLTYIVLNPFVAINLFTHRAVLASNLGNSTAMYSIGLGGLTNALALLAEGASPVVLIAGVIGLVALTYSAIQRRRANSFDEASARGEPGWLLLAPAGVVTIQFVLLADGKPPEYARFGLLAVTFLLVAAFTAIGRIQPVRARALLAFSLTVLTIAFGTVYILAFLRDCRPHTSRTRAAEQLLAIHPRFSRTVGVSAEPAPYIAPPIDLFTRELLYIPPGVEAFPQVRITLDPARSPAPISWADSRFRVRMTKPE